MRNFAIWMLVFVINGQICYWVGVYMGERRWTKRVKKLAEADVGTKEFVSDLSNYIDLLAERNRLIGLGVDPSQLLEPIPPRDFKTVSLDRYSNIDERGRPKCGVWYPDLGPCVRDQPHIHEEVSDER